MAALENAKPSIKPSNKRAAYLLTGLSLLTGLFTALGIDNDELPRIWRNHPVLSILSVSCLLAGMGLGAFAGWVLKEGAREEKALALGNLLLSVGLILAAWVAIVSASDRPQPTVIAAPIQKKGQTLVRVTAENSNLQADEDLTVMIEPLHEVEEPDGEMHYDVGRPLFSASLGPNDDGHVKRSIVVNLPPGDFDDVGVRAFVDPATSCYDEGSTTGCHLIRIPKRSQEPRLRFRWRKGKGKGVKLLVHVSALDIPRSSLQFVARGLRPNRRLLARVSVPANVHGDVQQRFVLPVAALKEVCVAAGTAKPPLACPPKLRERPGWAKLRVPSRG